MELAANIRDAAGDDRRFRQHQRNRLALALLLLCAALVMGARVIRLSVADTLRAIRRAMERVRSALRARPRRDTCFLLG